MVQAVSLSDLPQCDHPVSEWRPIKTAPKQPTLRAIVAVTGGQNGPVVGEAWWFEDGLLEDGGEWWWAGTHPMEYGSSPISETNYGEVSHWMPLPEPPQISGDRTA